MQIENSKYYKGFVEKKITTLRKNNDFLKILT